MDATPRQNSMLTAPSLPWPKAGVGSASNGKRYPMWQSTIKKTFIYLLDQGGGKGGEEKKFVLLAFGLSRNVPVAHWPAFLFYATNVITIKEKVK
jgi:hypothetical protein